MEVFLVLMKLAWALLADDHLERHLVFMDAAVLVPGHVVVAEEQNALVDEPVLILLDPVRVSSVKPVAPEDEFVRQVVAFQVAERGLDRVEHQDGLEQVLQVHRVPFQILVYLQQLPDKPNFCGAWFDIGRSLEPFLSADS